MSHLSTIIGRVKRSIKVNRKLPENQRLQASLSHAFNLAEYMTYNQDFSPEEAREAIRLLDLMGLPHVVDENHGASFYDVMKKLADDGKIMTIPSRTCQKCGRDLSNKVSVMHGMGPICYKKRVIEVARATAGMSKDSVIDGMDKISKEADPEIDPILGIKPENESTGIKLATDGIVLGNPEFFAAIAEIQANNLKAPSEVAGNPIVPPKSIKTTKQTNLFMYI